MKLQQVNYTLDLNIAGSRRHYAKRIGCLWHHNQHYGGC